MVFGSIAPVTITTHEASTVHGLWPGMCRGRSQIKISYLRLAKLSFSLF